MQPQRDALSDDELDLLRDTLRRVSARREVAGPLFYERLFDLDPSLRPMFSEDLAEQTEKVLFAFGAVVGQIHDLDACREMTRDLALRHVAYGVERRHYATVGRAVMEMLELALGSDLTPEAAAAWRKAYDSIATAMVEAAYGAHATA